MRFALKKSSFGISKLLWWDGGSLIIRLDENGLLATKFYFKLSGHAGITWEWLPELAFLRDHCTEKTFARWCVRCARKPDMKKAELDASLIPSWSGLTLVERALMAGADYWSFISYALGGIFPAWQLLHIHMEGHPFFFAPMLKSSTTWDAFIADCWWSGVIPVVVVDGIGDIVFWASH